MTTRILVLNISMHNSRCTLGAHTQISAFPSIACSLFISASFELLKMVSPELETKSHNNAYSVVNILNKHQHLYAIEN